MTRIEAIAKDLYQSLSGDTVYNWDQLEQSDVEDEIATVLNRQLNHVIRDVTKAMLWAEIEQ